jgi:hypothetical protein
MNQADIDEGGETVRKLLDLAIRYFSEEVGLEFSKLTREERDLYLHLKDHVFTAAVLAQKNREATDTTEVPNPDPVNEPENSRIIEEWENEPDVPVKPPVRIIEEWE